MAIKAGQFLHDVNGFVIDRIQSAGVGNLNIPEEKIYELGNYQTVATVRDIPDLSFDLESLDVSTEIEAVLTGKVESALADGTAIDLTNAVPIDVVSPFKSQQGQFNTVKGVAVPYLTLESATYRFGLRQNSTQQFSLKGDSIYYTPGTPFYENKVLTSGTSQTYTFTQAPAIRYDESGDIIYVLSVCVKNATTGAYKRLFFGTDFTNTTGGFTLAADWQSAGYDHVHFVYATGNSVSYTQTGNNPSGNPIHQGTGVKPAAVRGKDIDLYVQDPTLATPALVRWTGVQSVEVTRRVNLEADEEFGNYHYVTQDYDTAEVSGTITLKPADTTDLFNKINSILNVPASRVSGPHTSYPVPMEIRISDPDTGTVLKTLYVSDARFTPPALQGRVQQKLTISLPFSSDGGNLLVYKGSKP